MKFFENFDFQSMYFVFYKCAQFLSALFIILICSLQVWPWHDIVKKWRFPIDAYYLVSFLTRTKNLERSLILVPISGGGMISGIALAAKQINPATKIIAVEPKGKELGPCLKAKQRLWSNPPQFIDTIAEGIKTQQVIHFLLLYRKRLNFALPMTGPI